MKLITSKNWSQERLQALLNSFYEIIEAAEVVGDESIEIDFVTDLCLTSFDETFTEVGEWNEIPPTHTLTLDFVRKTARVKKKA